MDDKEIIALLYARSEQAIAELSSKYGAVCRRVAENILNHKLDAEECINDAYLAVWNTVPPQRPDPLSAYVCRIVRNLSIARYHANTALKRNSFYDVALDELEDCLAAPETVEAVLTEQELTAALDKFLGGLARESRVMFVRRYWYGDSIAEIAARFRISSNHVSVRLSRIRGKLRKYLKKEGYEL